MKKYKISDDVLGRARRLPLVLSAAVGLLWGGNVAQGAPLLNGGFESPAISPVSFVQASAAPLSDWTVVNGSADIYLVNGAGAWFGSGVAPQEGDQYLYLAGSSGSGYVEQTVTGLTIGLSYDLTGFASESGRPGSAAGSYKVTAVGYGDIVPFTVVDPTWTAFSGSFTATDTSVTIQIYSMGPGGAEQLALDNVALVVPEPTTIGLMVMGLMAFGGARKLRKSRTLSI